MPTKEAQGRSRTGQGHAQECCRGDLLGRNAAKPLQSAHEVSERRTCAVFTQHGFTHRYTPKGLDKDKIVDKRNTPVGQGVSTPGLSQPHHVFAACGLANQLQARPTATEARGLQSAPEAA